jgi:hypothetical protein
MRRTRLYGAEAALLRARSRREVYSWRRREPMPWRRWAGATQMAWMQTEGAAGTWVAMDSWVRECEGERVEQT